MEYIVLIIHSLLFMVGMMTQLIVYPSFLRYSEEELHQWHKSYTKRIVIITAPLMILELVLVSRNLLTELSLINLAAFSFVFGIWINTFVFAVPKHNNLSRKNDMYVNSRSLVFLNIPRTVLWFLLMAMSFYEIAIL